MPKSGLITVVSFLALFFPSFLHAENIKIYNRNWNLMDKIENGKIYDKNWNLQGRIVGATRCREGNEGNKVYDKDWLLHYKIEDGGTQYRRPEFLIV